MLLFVILGSVLINFFNVLLYLNNKCRSRQHTVLNMAHHPLPLFGSKKCRCGLKTEIIWLSSGGGKFQKEACTWVLLWLTSVVSLQAGNKITGLQSPSHCLFCTFTPHPPITKEIFSLCSSLFVCLYQIISPKLPFLINLLYLYVGCLRQFVGRRGYKSFSEQDNVVLFLFYTLQGLTSVGSSLFSVKKMVTHLFPQPLQSKFSS